MAEHDAGEQDSVTSEEVLHRLGDNGTPPEHERVVHPAPEEPASHTSRAAFPSPEKSAFCIGLKTYGQPVKAEANDAAELRAAMKDTSIAWVDVTVVDMKAEAPRVAALFGFSESIVVNLLAERYSSYEDRESELALLLPAVRVERLDVRTYPLILLIRNGVVLSIHPKEVVRMHKFARYCDTYMRKIPVNLPWADRLTLLAQRLMEENNERNYEGIRTIEEESDRIGKRLTNPKTPMATLGPEIYKMKHALVTYLNTQWSTLDVVKALHYGDAEVITDNPDILERFEMMVNDLTRHIQLGENLSEVLASGLEVLQGIYNNQLQLLNNRMAMYLTWLTIIGTAVLVPNTLATIFGIPTISELIAPFWVALILVVSTAVSTLMAYYILKWKGGLRAE